MNKSGGVGPSDRQQATRYTASRNHYVISTSFVQPYHVYPPVHTCAAPACLCTCVANPIEWNVYKHPLSLGQSFSLFHVFTPPNNGVKTQRISRRCKLHGVSLNKNERQGLINSIVVIRIRIRAHSLLYTNSFDAYTHLRNVYTGDHGCNRGRQRNESRHGSINNSVTTNIRLINKPRFHR